MKCKKIAAMVLAAALCAGLALPVHAAINPYAALEEKSRQAVAVAIQAGSLPLGTTIYDCAYHTGADNVVRVIQYKDHNGNWIDITTQKAMENATVSPSSKLTENQRTEYAKEVFDLVNKERRVAGLNEVRWDADFAVCAQIRAEELQYRFSHYRPVEPTAGRDNWPALIDGKEGVYNAPSVADEQGIEYTWIWENGSAGRATPEATVNGWMESKGHRDNILNENHTRCGVGVFYTAEKTLAGYSWYWVIWFDE